MGTNVKTVMTGRCMECSWQSGDTPGGDPDKTAEAHTARTGHPTVVTTRPA